MLLQREPVLITTLLRSAILLATAFGLRLQPEQIAAVLVFTEALLALFVRSKVASPATLGAGAGSGAVATLSTVSPTTTPAGQPAGS